MTTWLTNLPKRLQLEFNMIPVFHLIATSTSNKQGGLLKQKWMQLQAGIRFLRVIVEGWTGLLDFVLKTHEVHYFSGILLQCFLLTAVIKKINCLWFKSVLFSLAVHQCVLHSLPPPNIPSLGMRHAIQGCIFVCANGCWQYLFLVAKWSRGRASLWQCASCLDSQPSPPPPCSSLERCVCSGSPGTGGLRSDAPHCGTATPVNSSHSTPAGHTVSLNMCSHGSWYVYREAAVSEKTRHSDPYCTHLFFCCSVKWSLTLIQTQISQQLLDELPWNSCSIHVSLRMNDNNFRYPMTHLPT